MKTQIATNPSQSKRLLACGVDPNTADMYLSINMCPGENYGKYSTRVLGEDLLTLSEILRSIDHAPAWSLSALLELLPRKINDLDLDTALVLRPSRYSKGRIIEYIDGDVSYTLHSFRGFSLIEGCVLMIEWLTANGYTLNTK